MDSKVIHLFSTPVFSYDCGVPAALHQQLIKDCYQWKKESEGVKKSNNLGWHSETKIFQRPEKTFKSICNVFVRAIMEATKSIAPDFKENEYTPIGEGWVNISPQHAFNAPHDHPGFTWSGVYYVKVPEAKGRSGRIEFLDPRTNIAAMGLEFSTQSAYFAPKQIFHPKDNMLLIFPSYLRHWVYPNEENADRISIAFNAKFVRKPA
jgi:uncharacterized protein (TIGR02466 family)